MAPDSSTLALENPMDGGAWQAAVHGVAKSRIRLSDFTFTFHFSLSCIGEGNGNPLQCSYLENPRNGGAWWPAVSGVAQSRTRLKRLSSSRSMHSTGASQVAQQIESACNAGLGSIPGLGRSTEEGNSYLLQKSHAQRSLMGTVHRSRRVIHD